MNGKGASVCGDYDHLRLPPESSGMSDHHIVELMRWQDTVHKGAVKCLFSDG